MMMAICVAYVRLFTVTMGVAVAGPVLSGDIGDMGPQSFVSAPLAATSADWAGGYGGLTFGLAGWDGHAFRSGVAGAVIELDVSNGLLPDMISHWETKPIGGASLGYNVQRGTFVGGLELDLSTSVQDSLLQYSRVDPGPLFPGVVTNTSYQTTISSLTTLRFRGGVATGHTLFYGTAGLAAGRVANELVLTLPNFPGLPDGYTSPQWREDDLRSGFIVGGGLEQRLTDRISLKGEALYYNLADGTVEGRDPINFPGQEIDYTFNNDGYMLRIGLNVSF